MRSLRLLADDLTGALDTSAEFVGAFGPIDVVWSPAPLAAGEQSLASDSGTRELASGEAFAILRKLAPLLDGAGIAFKKIDSLLRGPWVAELDACLKAGKWDACIVAPAFPHQGRVTRSGKQFSRTLDGHWTAVGDDILRRLRDRGLEARIAGLAAPLEKGINVFDAETDADLDRVADIGRTFKSRLLWCGSGGLATALARGADAAVSARLTTPVLGVFGSDHPATAAQLARCGRVVIRSADIGSDIDQIGRALDRGVVFVQLKTAGALSRSEAASRFSQEIALLSRAIDPPRTVVVAGGETLKAQMLAVGASALHVLGRLEPGLPKSVIRGGRWAGVDVISKSGAFGPPDLWSKLLKRNGLT
ncbi:MAG TPA: four-carbon acid sugar kinase family protein [Bradyrhizobium sp.]|uniref:four-carbon acid sugar kinase family protein n=1 Tax=Bradyrhizobium sp. TaxID=376 RepID=UPI002B6652C6|nr:four-carbon acid sugar kinase family protein [Bradyrhizobium sp.]HLZ05505.1 four-carbon acid sugar kinase family protein [Bradyrhizobium sp.]